MAKPRVRIVSATEAKNNFGAIIKQAYAADEHLIVEKGGIPVVAIIPIAVYQQSIGTPPATARQVVRRVASASERAEASRRLTEFLARMHAKMPDVPEDEVDRDIAQAIREVRAERDQKTVAAKRKTHAVKVQPSRRLKV